MKKMLVPCLIIVMTGFAATAQTAAEDTLYGGQLKEVKVMAKYKNDTDRYHYNQTKYYVTTILPYLNAATQLFTDVNARIEDEHMGRKERRQYINSKEDEMRERFEDKVKSLNTTQGVLLVKLIARQTDMNIYKILKEFKNPLTAIKWQAWARLNGMNLDRKYIPDDEPMLENIMDELGYPLPHSYAVNR